MELTPVESEALVLLLVVPELLHSSVARADVLRQGARVLKHNAVGYVSVL